MNYNMVATAVHSLHMSSPHLQCLHCVTYWWHVKSHAHMIRYVVFASWQTWTSKKWRNLGDRWCISKSQCHWRTQRDSKFHEPFIFEGSVRLRLWRMRAGAAFLSKRLPNHTVTYRAYILRPSLLLWNTIQHLLRTHN